jgi:hypothetical protein
MNITHTRDRPIAVGRYLLVPPPCRQGDKIVVRSGCTQMGRGECYKMQAQKKRQPLRPRHSPFVKKRLKHAMERPYGGWVWPVS